MKLLKEQFSDLFELPNEIILDAPLIMMVGQKKLYIENHKGIALYQQDKLKVRLKVGNILIEGKDLLISEINTEYLFISGIIVSLNYEIKGGAGD